jgi:hypothetical protein
MIRISWSQSDISKFISTCENIRTKSGFVAGKVMETVANQIMAESKAEVPYDTGTLQNSAYITNAKYEGKEVYVDMGYGGPKDKRNPITKKMASQYALYVHETQGTYPGGGYYHPYGKWKFLEDPLRRNIDLFMSQLGIQIRNLISLGGKHTNV